MHPYTSLPEKCFWSRSVARNFSAGTVMDFDCWRVVQKARVASAGSCFASNMVPYLQRAGIEYVKTENVCLPNVIGVAENYGYAEFSAAYGHVYTARQLAQLLDRALGLFDMHEPFWFDGECYIDPLRPGLRYRSRTEKEFRAITAQHLRSVLEAITLADVFVFTLGLTEAWENVEDGCVYPACPGTVAGTFDQEKHRFVNFGATSVSNDLIRFIVRAREINPALKVILTVSPVPLVATAVRRHVLQSSVLSKSVLRVAADMVTTKQPEVYYFPSFELITGPQAPDRFFCEDRRNVTKEAVDFVMAAFLRQGTGSEADEAVLIPGQDQPLAASLSGSIVGRECEEMMTDQRS